MTETPAHESPTPMTLDLHQVAAILKCHPDTVRRLAAQAAIPGAFKVGRAWVFSGRRLQEWIEQP